MTKEMTTTNTETICVFDDPKIGDRYSSFSPDTMEGKVMLYNAINSPEKRIADFINTPINIRDVVVMAVKLSGKYNDEDKEPVPFDTEKDEKLRDGYRVILIDTDGVSYTATSNGIYNSVRTLRSVFGTLHFEEGLSATIRQVKTKNGKTLTMSLN